MVCVNCSILFLRLEESMSTVAVILAAGLGKRMKSDLPKVLHPVLGDPSLLWVLRSLPEKVTAAVLVLHHGKARVEAALASWQEQGLLPCPVTTVDQGEPLGTGHAVQQAVSELSRLNPESVLLLCGDVPLLSCETLKRMTESPAALLAMQLPDPTGYGRVLRNGDGSLRSIVEQRDASPEVLKETCVNGGAYVLPWKALKPALAGLSNENAQREYYLTDAVSSVAQYHPVSVAFCHPEELTGMNSRVDQAMLQKMAQARINRAWMEAGVTFLDSEQTLVGPRVKLGRDVLLEAQVTLEGDVEVGEGCRIGQGCVIRDSRLEKGVEMRPYCVAQKAIIGCGAKVGPFAHLREGSVLEADVHMGNFVETKKALLKKGSKANHLSYLGDCEVGERTNIGAGFITCNYDGFNKHKTLIGNDVFVGSDCQAVAPVTLEDGSLIAAGTTITADVPKDALAIARTQQINKADFAVKLRERFKAVKALKAIHG